MGVARVFLRMAILAFLVNGEFAAIAQDKDALPTKDFPSFLAAIESMARERIDATDNSLRMADVRQKQKAQIDKVLGSKVKWELAVVEVTSKVVGKPEGAYLILRSRFHLRPTRQTATPRSEQIVTDIYTYTSNTHKYNMIPVGQGRFTRDVAINLKRNDVVSISAAIDEIECDSEGIGQTVVMLKDVEFVDVAVAKQ